MSAPSNEKTVSTSTIEAAAAVKAASVRKQFDQINSLPIEGQARFLVRARFSEFQGRVGEVLGLAAEFASYAPPDTATSGGGVSELDEHAAHVFLERKGQTKTVTELRTYLREVDIDHNGKVSFLEHALWHFGITTEQLFEPAGLGDPELEECARQISSYYENKHLFEAEERRLEAAAAGVGEGASVDGDVDAPDTGAAGYGIGAAAGGSAVARAKAALDLQALRKRVTVRNRTAVAAASAERTTKKAAERRVAMELEADKAKAFEAETLRRARGKANIVARSQAFRVDDAQVVG